jgi:hypothetical protein
MENKVIRIIIKILLLWNVLILVICNNALMINYFHQLYMKIKGEVIKKENL